MKRKIGTAWIEQRTTWDTAYPIEPAAVTEDYGGSLARTTTYSYAQGSMGLLARVVEALVAGDSSKDRWTDYAYNANNDVVTVTVSRAGSSDDATPLRVVTRSCWSTQAATLPADLRECPAAAGLYLRRTIERSVAGGATDDDTNVATDYAVDAYGRTTFITRHNRSTMGTVLDDRVSGFVYEVTRADLLAEVANFADGAVTSPGDDISPNPTSGARTDLTTAYTYDTAGNRISAADPRRAILAATGSPAPDDYVTSWTFDPQNERISEKTPTTPGVTITQKTATTTYDELGAVRSATDFGGLVSATLYDMAGRAKETYEDPDGSGGTAAYQTGSSTFDPSGRILTARDQRQLADSNLGSTAYGYDELGRQTTVTEAAVSTPDLASVTQTTYDSLDRATVVEVGYGSPASQRTATTYDLGGRTMFTDDGFTCSTASFDFRDNTVTESFGRVGGTCASAGDTRTISHSLDALGRRTRSEVTAGPDLGDRTYDVTLDSAGNSRTSATRTGGQTATTTFSLTILDEARAEARPDGSTAKTNHDPAGNPTDACYWKPGVAVGACLPAGTTPWPDPPSQVTTTGYDARDNRISLRTPALGETTYDPSHDYAVAAVYVPTRVDGNGVATREFQALYAYEESGPVQRHRLASITERLFVLSSPSLHTCSSTVPTGSASYEYDTADSVTRVVEDNGTGGLDRRYCHDALGRLLYRNTGAACGSAAKDEAWTYDDAGNRLTAWTQASGVTRTFSYSAEGQLTAITNPAESLAYDSAGRVATYAGWSYEYDPEGRLVAACHAASCAGSGFDRVDVAYDGEGRRTKIVTTTAGGAVTALDLRYAGEALVQEITNGTVTREYVRDEAGTVVRFCDPDCASPTARYLVGWNGHGDALNVSRINADGTLTAANSYRYDTWGRPTTTTHNGIADLGFRYLYVGAADVQWDNQLSAGLLYMHARSYHPALGRFLQPDPARARRQPLRLRRQQSGDEGGPERNDSVVPRADCWLARL